MADSGLSAGDILALTKDNDNGWNNNPFIYLVWLALLGNGSWFGGNNSQGTEIAEQAGLTRQAIYDSNYNQDTNRNFGEIINLLNQNNNDTSLKIADVLSSINNNRYNAQEIGCEIKSGIKDLVADNYKNTCEITNAIHSEGETTRALITANTIQQLRDDLAAKDRELLESQFRNSQQEQNMLLVNTLRPFPIPSYNTCSPYTSSNSACSSCTTF